MSKEFWLIKHGRVIPQPTRHRDGDNIAVVFIDNGGFTAAGVAYNAQELAAFSDPDDPRPKRWFSVPIAELIKVGAIQNADDIKE
jgi:hypothetical protein